MISCLRGRVVELGPSYCVIDVGGVGYVLSVPGPTRHYLESSGPEAFLYVRMLVRENDVALYGFATKEDRELFDCLTSVSGVGPRTAMSVLSSMRAERFRAAVTTEDVDSLRAISGIGPKMARRLVTELKDKLGSRECAEAGPGRAGVPAASGESAVGDAIAALLSLGYTYAEAAGAAAGARSRLGESATAVELVRQALRDLGEGRGFGQGTGSG